MDAAIKRFKHRQDWPMGHLLAERLAAWLEYRFEEGLARPQQLLPVPLAAARQRKRGFNQAQMLGQWLAKRLAIPLSSRSLMRPKHTPSQQGLGLAARQQNLQAAFTLGPGAKVVDQHVALVDDVLTTGATASALSALLLKAGARRVDVYCLARTPGVGPVE
jgi:ComF family protein